jgi:hypothetical protein
MIHPFLLNIPQLLHLKFPHLVKCKLYIDGAEWGSTDKENTLASFLLRHPALELLEIHGPIAVAVRQSAWARIRLPHLRYLRSPVVILPSIVAEGLTEAKLVWNPGGTDDVEAIIVALKSMTRTDIPFVSCNENCSRQCTAVVDSISRNTPHTKTLGLRIYYPLAVRFPPFIHRLLR